MNVIHNNNNIQKFDGFPSYFIVWMHADAPDHTFLLYIILRFCHCWVYIDHISYISYIIFIYQLWVLHIIILASSIPSNKARHLTPLPERLLMQEPISFFHQVNTAEIPLVGESVKNREQQQKTKTPHFHTLEH